MSEELSPNGLRVFTLNIGDDKPAEKCILGIKLGDSPVLFTVTFATQPEDDDWDPTAPWTILSYPIFDRPISNPDAEGRYSFWKKADSDKYYKQLLAQGIVEKDPRLEVQRGAVTFPLVRVKIPLSQMSKQCGNCFRWELTSDEKRMGACSRCLPESRIWYCNKECQKQDWSSPRLGRSHKKICGKTREFLDAAHRRGMQKLLAGVPIISVD